MNHLSLLLAGKFRFSSLKKSWKRSYSSMRYGRTDMPGSGGRHQCGIRRNIFESSFICFSKFCVFHEAKESQYLF